jgi:hypothetical protein
METARGIDSKMATLEEESAAEKHLCLQSEFYLEARRVKLLKDLRNIYPISIVPSEERYAIRDLRIPLDIHSGTVSEDELSAALGFLSHLVALLGKYLSVKLRYRVFPNSSRSAIQEDGATVYPLFQARVVERDQLDYGVLLLQRNVECILKTRDKTYLHQEHLLINVKRLFDTIVDGDL